jgi:DNA-binding transcriptional LysR family regulator
MFMQWNLEQIRLFVSVAEQRSFSAVARDSRRAQSAVSGAIAMLETDSGRQPVRSQQRPSAAFD